MKYGTPLQLVNQARRQAVSKTPYLQPTPAPSKATVTPPKPAQPTNWLTRFGRIVSAVDMSRTKNPKLAQGGINGLLIETEGQKLVGDLETILLKPPEKRIHLSFLDTIPQGDDEGNTGGFFSPDNPDYHTFDIFVSIKALAFVPDSRGTTMEGVWPGARGSDGRFTADNIWFTHKTPESLIADTLYHELLHIWFMHQTNLQMNFGITGHMDVLQGEIESLFLARLRKFSHQLDVREGATR